MKQLLENLKKEYPAVIEDINPEVLPLGNIQKVLQNLAREFIPIKDLVQILESLIDYSKVTKNIDVLTEYVRHSLGETIANLYKDPNGIIHVVTLGDRLENLITKALQENNESVQTLGLSPDLLKKLNISIEQNINKLNELGYAPVFITSATIRPYFYKLINSTFPEVAVISYTELPANIELEFLSSIEV